jgi:phosphopantothenoylcysteine decarboxylase / phosphopantothenate---cysteine ligase
MPNPLENKRIVLGVTGSIAAYKAIDLASKLKQANAQVDVILTESALKFVSTLSFQSVTGSKAFTDADLWGGEGHVVHVSHGHAAELMVIAPASANTIAKLANGIADNLLTTTALVADCPLVIAPAMESHMYTHLATQQNIQTLQERGAIFIGPAEGHLASGAIGKGRFVETPEIFNHLRWLLSKNGALKGRKVVVTAGGTQEPIDPVRMITNRSSGKQGFAIVQAALDSGADVILIAAPSSLPTPMGCKRIEMHTAAEMQRAVLDAVKDADVLVMAAAVADFRPAKPSDQKIKKDKGLSSIELEPTSDILAAVAEQKTASGYPRRTIGFAAESQKLIENARVKLQVKKLDLIAANDVTAKGAGFEVDTNRITLCYASGEIEPLPLLSKAEIAEKLVGVIIRWFPVTDES